MSVRILYPKSPEQSEFSSLGRSWLARTWVWTLAYNSNISELPFGIGGL
jgi:hypothetical protein